MRHSVGIGVVLLVVGLVSSSDAQGWPELLSSPDWPWSVPQQPHPAVARITVPQRDRSLALGSGTLVDANGKLGLVVTNWHVVDGAAGEITVAFPSGFRSGAKVLKVDRDWDLAALAIQKPPVQPVPLSNQPPQPGEALTIAGYGSGRYRAATGRCTQYVAPGPNFPYEMLEVGVAARQGDSGGPIFNSSGQLAGVLFGEGGGRTSGSYCRRVHLFLSNISIATSDLTAPAVVAAAASGAAALPVAGRPPSGFGQAQPLPSQPPTIDLYGLPRASTPARPDDPPLAAQAAVSVQQPKADVSAVEQPPAANGNRFRQPAADIATSNRLPPGGAIADLSAIDLVEQVKSALAVIGAMAIVLQGFRWLRSG